MISQIVATRLSILTDEQVPKGAGSGSRDPLKIVAIESAQNRRATIRLGIYTLIANI